MIRVLLAALAMGGSYFAFRIVYQLFGDLQDALERERREFETHQPDLEALSRNARLEAGGLRREFRRAAAARDTHRMDAILRRLEERERVLPHPPSDSPEELQQFARAWLRGEGIDAELADPFPSEPSA